MVQSVAVRVQPGLAVCRTWAMVALQCFCLMATILTTGGAQLAERGAPVRPVVLLDQALL